VPRQFVQNAKSMLVLTLSKRRHIMNLELPVQRLIITALKTQIHFWETRCEDVSLSEGDVAALQKDINHAHVVLSTFEENLLKNAEPHPT
jgi:hypothetical protein